MKKNVLFCLMIMGILSCFAQTPVPNFGFENWTTVSGHEYPLNWLVRDTSGSKTTDKYAGNYAIRIQSIILAGDTMKGEIASLPPDSSEGMTPSFSVSARHATLNGYYKFNSLNGDSCQFIVFMFNHDYVNPSSFNLLGGAWQCKAASSVYSPFTLNIDYFDYPPFDTIPDSSYISCAAFKGMDFSTGTELDPHGNSVLYLDNISFDGFMAGINNVPDLIKDVNLYPNPASTFLNIDMNLDKSDYTVNLYDMNAHLIKTIANNNLSGYQNLSVNIEDIPAGDYLLMISTDRGFCSKKVSIIR
jgi:hypothetical protein